MLLDEESSSQQEHALIPKKQCGNNTFDSQKAIQVVWLPSHWIYLMRPWLFGTRLLWPPQNQCFDSISTSFHESLVGFREVDSRISYPYCTYIFNPSKNLPVQWVYCELQLQMHVHFQPNQSISIIFYQQAKLARCIYIYLYFKWQIPVWCALCLKSARSCSWNRTSLNQRKSRERERGRFHSSFKTMQCFFPET
jgi:hypothetical protein